MLLPSSHCCPLALSTGRRMPSPHTDAQAPPPAGQLGSLRQNGLQPSPELLLPSSHSSEPSCTPLPQVVCTQGWPGVGHIQAFLCVGPGLSSWHVELQPSPARVLPSSHCSLP